MADARASARWYRRLGFHTEWEHQFGPEFPVMVAISRNGRPGTRMFLSEHTGDATPDGLVYIRVSDVAAIAVEFDAESVLWKVVPRDRRV